MRSSDNESPVEICPILELKMTGQRWHYSHKALSRNRTASYEPRCKEIG
jgi:hypothetical protein